MAFAPQSQGQFHRHSHIAGGVVPHKGGRHIVSAVIHPGGGAVILREGDVILFGDHQLAFGFAGGHNDFGQSSLGLAGGCDADRALPHDCGRIVGQALDGAARTVRADVGDSTDGHLRQHRGQSPVCRLHHSKEAPGRLKAAAGGCQFRRRTGQQRSLQNAVCRLGIGLSCGPRERLAVHRDAGRERLRARRIQAGAEPCFFQNPCCEGSNRGLAGGACHRDILDGGFYRRRQGRCKVLGRIKAVGQRCKELVCLLHGLDGTHD